MANVTILSLLVIFVNITFTENRASYNSGACPLGYQLFKVIHPPLADDTFQCKYYEPPECVRTCYWANEGQSGGGNYTYKFKHSKGRGDCGAQPSKSGFITIDIYNNDKYFGIKSWVEDGWATYIAGVNVTETIDQKYCCLSQLNRVKHGTCTGGSANYGAYRITNKTVTNGTNIKHVKHKDTIKIDQLNEEMTWENPIVRQFDDNFKLRGTSPYDYTVYICDTEKDIENSPSQACAVANVTSIATDTATTTAAATTTNKTAAAATSPAAITTIFSTTTCTTAATTISSLIIGSTTSPQMTTTSQTISSKIITTVTSTQTTITTATSTQTTTTITPTQTTTTATTSTQITTSTIPIKTTTTTTPTQITTTTTPTQTTTSTTPTQTTTTTTSTQATTTTTPTQTTTTTSTQATTTVRSTQTTTSTTPTQTTTSTTPTQTTTSTTPTQTTTTTTSTQATTTTTITTPTQTTTTTSTQVTTTVTSTQTTTSTTPTQTTTSTTPTQATTSKTPTQTTTSKTPTQTTTSTTQTQTTTTTTTTPTTTQTATTITTSTQQQDSSGFSTNEKSSCPAPVVCTQNINIRFTNATNVPAKLYPVTMLVHYCLYPAVFANTRNPFKLYYCLQDGTWLNYEGPDFCCNIETTSTEATIEDTISPTEITFTELQITALPSTLEVSPSKSGSFPTTKIRQANEAITATTAIGSNTFLGTIETLASTMQASSLRPEALVSTGISTTEKSSCPAPVVCTQNINIRFTNATNVPAKLYPGTMLVHYCLYPAVFANTRNPFKLYYCLQDGTWLNYEGPDFCCNIETTSTEATIEDTISPAEISSTKLEITSIPSKRDSFPTTKIIQPATGAITVTTAIGSNALILESIETLPSTIQTSSLTPEAMVSTGISTTEKASCPAPVVCTQNINIRFTNATNVPAKLYPGTMLVHYCRYPAVFANTRNPFKLYYCLQDGTWLNYEGPDFCCNFET